MITYSQTGGPSELWTSANKCIHRDSQVVWVRLALKEVEGGRQPLTLLLTQAFVPRNGLGEGSQDWPRTTIHSAEFPVYHGLVSIRGRRHFKPLLPRLSL